MKPDIEEEEALARLREWSPGGDHGGDASQVVTAVAPYTELGGAATRIDRPNAVKNVDGGDVLSNRGEQAPRTTGQVQQNAGGGQSPGNSIPPGLHPLKRSPALDRRGTSLGESGGRPEHVPPLRQLSVERTSGDEVVSGGPEPQYGGTHYQRLNPEPIEVIESWGLGYNLGNVIKYVARAGHKSTTTATEDLTKARWYINRALANL